MSNFKERLNNDAVLTFLHTSEFAETIVYTPKGGTAKQIPAIVDRKRLIPSGEDSGRTLVNQIEILIANDAENGVISINKGGDTVSLPERIGDASVSWVVADILGQDEGMWHLLITH
ncbi:MAG: hypothetical protein PHG31_05015 [Candidatus Omnitrophica bacterium]|nr:hypothetical protein [Candidatus Omnitrophota bacterium]